MKSWWLFGSTAIVSAWVGLSACSSSTGGGVGTGGTTHTTTTTHPSSSSSSSSSSGTGGTTTSTDPVCSDPNASVSKGCVTCVNQLQNTQPCIQTFLTQCQGDAQCTAYLKCQNACVESANDAGLSGAGGGGTACVAGEATGDAGSLENNCITCCQNANTAGVNTFVTDLINSCVCAAGAPCASACAM